jgi:hypothetical protein
MGIEIYKFEDDEIAKDLKTVADSFYKEDEETRQQQLRHWKRLKYYWNNFSQIYWSDVAHDYRIWGRDSAGGSNDQSYYDRPVNVFKAFLETIVAALSVQIPPISCIPDDAESPLDLSTAKAGNKISELIYKHNDAIFLWMQALYVYCTEGLIACYTYTKEDESYGTYQKKNYKDEEVEGYYCPNCKTELDEEFIIQGTLIKQMVQEKFNPGPEDSELLDFENEVKRSLGSDPLVCPNCALALDENLQKTKLMIPRFIGTTSHPKSRICMEVYGGLYVKVSNTAKKQEDTPTLHFVYDTHYSNVIEAYPELRDKVQKGGISTGMNDPYDQYARTNIQYRGSLPDNHVAVHNCWMRPSAFHILEEEKAKRLRDKFPQGAKIVIVNDTIAEYCAESLDDHWTLTQNPMSDYLTHEPLGEVLTNIQDIVNDLISLTLQTIEHGVSQTWVDPAVVNLDAQGQLEVIPGALTPTKQVSATKNISEAFFQTKTASLSPETFSFYKIVNELGQFVSGALPSVFGGVMEGAGGETAAAYAQSKGMALQRLQTPWKMLTVWWKKIFGKAIPQYMQIMVEDERMVEKDKQGNFINVFIRKSEMGGKIGSVELEASEQLPISDEQQRDVVMQLMQLNNMEIFNALVAPENLPFIRKLVRIPQFKLPGEDDRQKQYEEITELMNSVPIVIQPDPMQQLESVMATGAPAMPVEEPSVLIDPILDNHKIESDICRSWLVSEAGRLAKVENPEGYKNVLLHMQMHIAELQKQMAIAQMQQGALANKETTSASGKQQKQKTSGVGNGIQ